MFITPISVEEHQNWIEDAQGQGPRNLSQLGPPLLQNRTTGYGENTNGKALDKS